MLKEQVQVSLDESIKTILKKINEKDLRAEVVKQAKRLRIDPTSETIDISIEVVVKKVRK